MLGGVYASVFLHVAIHIFLMLVYLFQCSNLGCTAFKVNTTAENPNVVMSLLEAEESKYSESVAATLPVEKAFEPTLFAEETWKSR